MATEALKSTPITNLDTIPVVPNTTGEGAPGFLRSVKGGVNATTGVTSGSTYRLCRIPTNAKVKHVLLTNAALSTSTAADVNIAHSDATNDGTPASIQGTIPQISAADNKLFGAAVALASAQSNLDIVNNNLTNFPYGSDNIPLWTVLGFTQDPGGMFDILVKTTATVTAGGFIGVEVQYVE